MVPEGCVQQQASGKAQGQGCMQTALDWGCMLQGWSEFQKVGLQGSEMVKMVQLWQDRRSNLRNFVVVRRDCQPDLNKQLPASTAG